MKIAERRQLFRLLGLLALMLVSGVMLAGCDMPTMIVGGGLVLGGIIGKALGHVFIGIIIGGIVSLVIFLILGRGGNSRGSSSSSSAGPYNDYAKLRRNGVRKCCSCTMYLSKGVCRRDNSSKSAEDSCSNWD